MFGAIWSNFGDNFEVKSCPKSCPKLGPKMDPEKSGPGSPLEIGPGRVLFLTMQVLGECRNTV